MLSPKHLVFAGGGPRCLSFLGAFEVLQKKQLFNNVSHYWGNSAGAIVATFLSLKIPLPKLRSIFETLDFTKFRDIDLTNIVSFGEKWGLDSGVAFTSHMKELLEIVKPGASQYTLQEVPGLHIVSADLTDTKMVILDGTSFPTLKLVDALRASTSIPFFYIPFRNPINNHILIDGGIGTNFPWELLPSDEDRKSAIGFNFKIYDTAKEPENLSEYIPKILHFRESSKSGILNKNKEEPNVMYFNVRGFPAWHLALIKKDRDELISIGKKTAEDWLILRSAEETKGIQHTNALPDIQPLSHHSLKQLSDSHGYPPQPLRPAVSQGSPSLLSRAYRRWSV